MTAPGKNLDFLEGDAFRRRCAPVPWLAVAVKKLVRDHPPLQGLHAVELEVEGLRLGVVLDRQGQRISLVYIFQLPEEEASYSNKLLELRQRRERGRHGA